MGEYLIFDIWDEGDPPEYDDWDDGSGWLGALAPLRAELISGDWRLPHHIWLAAVGNGSLRDEEREPLPGKGREPERNLSTILRHRRFLFTDSFLLLWKWRVG